MACRVSLYRAVAYALVFRDFRIQSDTAGNNGIAQPLDSYMTEKKAFLCGRKKRGACSAGGGPVWGLPHLILNTLCSGSVQNRLGNQALRELPHLMAGI
jgi:hypothetical protein